MAKSLRLPALRVPLVLPASAGHGGANAPDDVTRVQLALARAAAVTLDARLHPGPADGHSGVGTEGAIERLQRRMGSRRPDARIDPTTASGGTGATLARLNAWLRIADDLADGKISFPFRQSSRWPFVGPGSGMRAFAARRSGGRRAHAGVDLYFPDSTPVLAIADGVVIRNPYPFYLKTWALEVDHGSFVARYGELDPDVRERLRKGDRVRRGDQVGRVGVLIKPNGRRLGVPSMMLHVEVAAGTEPDGTSFTQKSKGRSARSLDGTYFFRRKDLLDPSGILRHAPLPK